LNRLNVAFENLASTGRKAVIPYIVAGDPSPDYTVALMHQLVASGADAIELGVPFSDPMAEGPVIQLAHERALEFNVGMRDIFAMVAEFRQQDTNTPVILMGYANPVIVMGYSVFAEQAAKAGVDALLTVDLPPEEGVELQACLDEKGINSIYLVAPTTTELRMQTICKAAQGYIYYVSLKGVTGSANLDATEVAQRVAILKRYTQLPVCVGFGIKDGESARRAGKGADGVIVGSALVQHIADLAKLAKLDKDNLAPAVSIVADIRKAVDAAA
jgi:tryptophan synthase alpha chain